MTEQADHTLMLRVSKAQIELGDALAMLADRLTPEQMRLIPSEVLHSYSKILMELGTLILVNIKTGYANMLHPANVTLKTEDDPNAS